jgi:hypothetical protein
MTRTQTLMVAGALAICLIAGSPQRLVGDGREYLAQAIEFASLHGPAFRPADIPHIQEELARFDPALANWDIQASTVADINRGRSFLHFWCYALLAAPGLWLANALGAPPTSAFTLLNLILLGAALWVALPPLGPAACLLLFAPIVWWIDKAHTEVFTFALLTITVAEMKDRPWSSMLAAAAASTQNPPIAVLVPIVFVAAVIRCRSALTDRRVILGVTAAVALVLLHPIYTYTHHGTWSLLLQQTRSGAPTFQMWSAVVLDPSVGLIGSFPLFLIVVIAGVVTLVRHSRECLLSEDVIIPMVTAAIFLFSFSRTTNVHHGGTPAVSRYALWLIPLALPLLAMLNHAGGAVWRRFLWSAAVVSALISVFAFHPSVAQNSREPTWLASFLWTRFPALNNPLPEVFVETQLQVDELRVPVATSGCEKILVAGGNSDSGIWPSPCYPAQLPADCQAPGTLCYANLTGRQYEFVPVRGTTVHVDAVRADAVWPANTVTHARKLYEAWNWPDMRARSLNVVRAANNVSFESLGSNERFILVLRNPRDGATVRLRPSMPMQGVLIDAVTGETLRSVEYSGEPGGMMAIDLPHDSRILLLAMRAN